MSETTVGIVGDFDPGRPSHEATNAALSHAGLPSGWIPTDEIAPDRPAERLAPYAGLFISPGSPYRSMEGALAAVRHARERGVPLVGT
jgi:CTP synthase (UTP-ammonia lyase)